jgi:hypothetical protein
MKMKCKNCKYEWNYKGNALFAQCPMCRKFTKIPKMQGRIKNETI